MSLTFNTLIPFIQGILCILTTGNLLGAKLGTLGWVSQPMFHAQSHFQIAATLTSDQLGTALPALTDVVAYEDCAYADQSSMSRYWRQYRDGVNPYSVV